MLLQRQCLAISREMVLSIWDGFVITPWIECTSLEWVAIVRHLPLNRSFRAPKASVLINKWFIWSFRIKNLLLNYSAGRADSSRAELWSGSFMSEVDGISSAESRHKSSITQTFEESLKIKMQMWLRNGYLTLIRQLIFKPPLPRTPLALRSDGVNIASDAR